jgi:two-component system nitrogen regulation response regulator NtrX
MPKALIIDDERAIRSAIREILEYEKIEVDEAEDGLQGVVKVKGAKYDVILCDIKMPKMDGTEVLDRIILLAPDTPVVMISGHGTIETAVDALKRGAYDYIPKPLDLNRLLGFCAQCLRPRQSGH